MLSAMTEIWKTDLQPIWDSLIAAKRYAEIEAQESPCVRRKYGAILFNNYIDYDYVIDEGQSLVSCISAHNNRVSRCCDHGCIRDLMSIQHGHNTDLGAEVHAEQSLLVKTRGSDWQHFLIVGFDSKGKPFYDKQCWPCYSCARIVKEAKIKGVWIPLKNEGFKFYLMDEILEEYESEISID